MMWTSQQKQKFSRVLDVRVNICINITYINANEASNGWRLRADWLKPMTHRGIKCWIDGILRPKTQEGQDQRPAKRADWCFGVCFGVIKHFITRYNWVNALNFRFKKFSAVQSAGPKPMKSELANGLCCCYSYCSTARCCCCC